MRKCNFILLVILSVIIISNSTVNAQKLDWHNISKEIMEVRCILLDENNAQLIYIGTEQGVFKTTNGGKNWEVSLFIKGENTRVNNLIRDKLGIIYAISASGLFSSNNQGISWKKIFRGKNLLENDCQSLVIIAEQEYYLGTKDGLFITKDAALTWQKVSGRLKKNEILALIFDKKKIIIYALAKDGVYKINPEQPRSYNKVFLSSPMEDENVAGTSDQEKSWSKDSTLRHLAIDKSRGDVYLATKLGLYRSGDNGKDWELIPSFGLFGGGINFVVIAENSKVYATTQSNAFRYSNGSWRELSMKLPVASIRQLAKSIDRILYAATEKGLYRAQIIKDRHITDNDSVSLRQVNKKDPSIRQLHQAAIKYVEVIDPKSIKNHRRQARLKALLPNLSVDFDKTINTYSNSSGTRFTVGPRDWGISLSWDLGDLVWSEQQRLIDSQVRLMIQLRNDILDEITKIYFTRLRIKKDLISERLENNVKAEKELRLAELTASLDALTGGYFSKFREDN